MIGRWMARKAKRRRTREDFARSRIRHAIVASMKIRRSRQSSGIDGGGFRLLDPEQPPVNLSPPIMRARERKTSSAVPTYAAAWRQGQIAAAVPG